MNKKILFYFLNNHPFPKFIGNLCEKIISSNNKILIYNQDIEYLSYIDKSLWNFSKIKFIPHLLQDEREINILDKIHISNIMENKIKSNYLIFFEQIDDINFLNLFDKLLFIPKFFNEDKVKNICDFYVNKNIKIDKITYKDNKWIINNK